MSPKEARMLGQNEVLVVRNREELLKKIEELDDQITVAHVDNHGHEAQMLTMMREALEWAAGLRLLL